jgi:hypothetical protein
MTLWIRSESVFSQAHTFEARRVSKCAKRLKTIAQGFSPGFAWLERCPEAAPEVGTTDKIDT